MISATNEAVKKIKSALWETDYVRVGVASGGCSGLSYSLDVEDIEEKRENDVVVEIDDVVLRIDPISSEMLSHTTIDYVKDKKGSGFKFEDEKDAADTKSCCPLVADNTGKTCKFKLDFYSNSC